MTSISPARSSYSPLHLETRSVALKITAVVSGTLILALTSQIEVPMIPVPITLQTLIVPLIGALYGWRLGFATVLAWLGQAMIGLPVLAGGAGGLVHFVSPTGGYLAAFPIIAALTGYLAEHGYNGNRAGLAFISFLLANLICLIIGALWLAGLIGIEKAVAYGVTPFLAGAVIKSALGAAILKAITRAPKAD